jgi:hypothetical protein
MQLHTAMILVIIFVFWFKVYDTGDQIGTPAKMWDLLHEAAKRNDYSAPTKDGSYSTIRSLGALKLAILSILEYTKKASRLILLLLFLVTFWEVRLGMRCLSPWQLLWALPLLR